MCGVLLLLSNKRTPHTIHVNSTFLVVVTAPAMLSITVQATLERERGVFRFGGRLL